MTNCSQDVATERHSGLQRFRLLPLSSWPKGSPYGDPQAHALLLPLIAKLQLRQSKQKREERSSYIGPSLIAVVNSITNCSEILDNARSRCSAPRFSSGSVI